jgi:hypothetical protein
MKQFKMKKKQMKIEESDDGSQNEDFLDRISIVGKCIPESGSQFISVEKA